MLSENKLAIKISKLRGFESPNVLLEQYVTPSDIAAKILWFAYMQGDIEGKIVADFGCGTGILGIGALLLEAKRVYFVDIDGDVLEIAKDNYNKLKLEGGEFLNVDIVGFDKEIDCVIQNPPFGVKKMHADREFLEKALEVSKVIYSFHKIESEGFINKFCCDNNAEAKKIFIFDFPLKATQKYHKKEVYKVKIGVWRIIKR